jgi:hypothetical protein
MAGAIMFNQATRAGLSRNSIGSVRENAERLEVWEDDGGSNSRPAAEALRVLIVDNDMAAADALLSTIGHGDESYALQLSTGFERYLFKPVVTGDIASLMAPSGA